MTMEAIPVNVLLVEDDEDDYILVRDLLAEISPDRYVLIWERSYDAGLEAIDQCRHDVCLLDYGLESHTGLELLRAAIKNGSRMPIIFLTGQGAYEIDVEAMKAGAADYLIKDEINALVLDRSIRYAIERKRIEGELRESQQQLKALSLRLINTQEDERKRVAKELHDGIGQILTAVKFGVESSLQLTNCQEVPCRQSLSAVISVIQNGIDEVRRISKNLWPTMLNEFGLLSTVRWYCREFQNIFSGMRIEKALEVSEDDVPDSLKITVYRILQEATNNAAKHSKGDLVSLSLKKTDRCLMLTVGDNGQGFDLDRVLAEQKSQRGLGLLSMKERTELSGGSFSIESSPGKGTVVNASWQLPA